MLRWMFWIALFTGPMFTFAADDVSPTANAEPVSLRWSFTGGEGVNALTAESIGTDPLTLTPQGKVETDIAGPRPSEYPDFDPANTAVRIPSGKNYLSLDDPGDGSVLDFTNGDSITLAAWVRWDEPLKGAYPYIIGKGRTHSGPGTHYNHNYALR
ncbi:MAG: hypothetical protein KDA75_12425, partial [Planctomycetaceae bacterium]|nr:hypothetical protein [Planctomycetaceae bacterium]